MSWWAHLDDDRGHNEGEWGYTHNTSPMLYVVLDDAGVVLSPDPDRPDRTMPWWMHLRTLNGPEGAAFLNVVIKGLEADPDRFRAMNPANGWGDYDTFLKVLTEMRDAVPEWPTQWSASG
jgi:hypothetical protein